MTICTFVPEGIRIEAVLPNYDAVLMDHAVTLLGIAFKDPKSFIRQIVGEDLSDDYVLCELIPVHFALMTVSSDVSYVAHLLGERGFRITQQFPSEVIAARLTEKYHRPDIAVTILKAQNGSGQELELLVVIQGLAKGEIIQELSDCIHFAFAVKGEELFQTLTTVDELRRSGFVPNGGGLNEVEGVTVLYFKKDHSALGSVVIELLIPGICRELVEGHTGC